MSDRIRLPSIADGTFLAAPRCRYRVLRRIATGGMAEVLLVRIERPGGFQRDFALKLLLPELVRGDIDFVDMMEEEARIGALLDHPNLCNVYDLWRDVDACAVLMEYVDGVTFGDLLRNHAIPELADVRFAVGLATQACRGLHYLHELCDRDGRPLRLVHRDVTPQNLMVTIHGRVKVLDLGIASERAGLRMGKASYMSPEQAAGEPLDPRTDVYAVGIVLYELLTGEPLFRRETRNATLAAATARRPTPLDRMRDDVPRALSAEIMRALSFDALARHDSAHALGHALAEAVAGLGGPASDDEIRDALAHAFARTDVRRAQPRMDSGACTEVDETTDATEPHRQRSSARTPTNL